ncbi:MAG: OmpA family protein, partial [bacterium]|nr:OmpA family protein [bacterium]
MLQKSLKTALLFIVMAALAFGQGLNTIVSKGDWEEINFEFDSDILSDGFPSLLRLAELLNQNADHAVTLVGHTDARGADQYNEGLAQRRGNAVKEFLEKYGARAGQITVQGQGERQPKVASQSDEARFMNRRVELVVRDGDGGVVSAGGVGDAIKALEKLAQKQEECCNEILKRLDKLDEILAALNQLKDENAALRRDLDELKKAQPGLETKVQQVAEALKPPAQPSEDVLAKVAEKAAKKAVGGKQSVFSLLGFNVGPDTEGDLTFTGKGRLFKPLGERMAIQSEAEFMSWEGRKEGQFDIGLVARHKSLQLGGFASFKHVSFSEYQQGGTLGQASLTGDYLFKHGRVGLFGSKGFMDRALLNTRAISANIVENTYARTVDQFGVSTTLGLWDRSYVEGNLGFLKGRQAGNKAGGMARLVLPFKHNWAFTVEGGLNETLLASDNYGRIAFGIQYGSFLSPKRYTEVNHPVPADIPRLRFELVTERVRTGNDPPVAVAGPNLVGVAAGMITLDGSASFDPDGDPITFQWEQVAGPQAALSGADTAQASFEANEGQAYGFLLTVRDDHEGVDVDRITIATKELPRVRIISFTATPPQIQIGGKSTLTWNVENADEVTIENIGTVDPQTGAKEVSPTTTTSYLLTARNNASNTEAQATAIVVVDQQPRFLRCQVTPANIVEGETATISWETSNATTVMMSGIGDVALNGSQMVSPMSNTTYTLTASNAAGNSIDCPLTVQVTRGNVPQIINFTAHPMEIKAGGSSYLQWGVENAETVTITGIGTVNSKTGATEVNPMETTSYVMTATNEFGSIAAEVTVKVVQPVRILSFVAQPNPVAANEPFVLSWSTENATTVSISNNLGPRPETGSAILQIPVTTTYTIVASNGEFTETASVEVVVSGSGPEGQRPVANAGPDQQTTMAEVTLDGSASDTDPPGGNLTYEWRSLKPLQARVLDANQPMTRVQFLP